MTPNPWTSRCSQPARLRGRRHQGCRPAAWVSPMPRPEPRPPGSVLPEHTTRSPDPPADGHPPRPLPWDVRDEILHRLQGPAPRPSWRGAWDACPSSCLLYTSDAADDLTRV